MTVYEAKEVADAIRDCAGYGSLGDAVVVLNDRVIELEEEINRIQRKSK